MLIDFSKANCGRSGSNAGLQNSVTTMVTRSPKGSRSVHTAVKLYGFHRQAGVPGFTGTRLRPKASGPQRVPGSAAQRMAPREGTGRDFSPAVTEVAERTKALITIRPRSTGPFALLQTPAPQETRQQNRAHPDRPAGNVALVPGSHLGPPVAYRIRTRYRAAIFSSDRTRTCSASLSPC